MGNPYDLHGRYAVIHFCFSLLAMAVFGVLAIGAGEIRDALSIDGAVRVPEGPALLELKGVPEERIRLRLFDLDSDARAQSSDLHVRFEDQESGLLTDGPVQIRYQTVDGGQAVFATLTVPEIPGRDRATLTGTLYGSIQVAQERPRSLEIPLLLQVGMQGEVVTSGSFQAPLPQWLGAIILSDAVVLGLFVAWLASCYLLFGMLLYIQASATQLEVQERTVN